MQHEGVICCKLWRLNTPSRVWRTSAARRRTRKGSKPMRKTIAALAAVLAITVAQVAHAQDKPKPIRALLVLGGCCHDYAKQKDILARGLQERANVEVTIAFDPDKT